MMYACSWRYSKRFKVHGERSLPLRGRDTPWHFMWFFEFCEEMGKKKWTKWYA